MRNKFNRKAKASGRLLRNNKGLTLVELVVAIAVLGILVSPVLHAFTTSQTIETKARRLSEATDAAHNVIEVIDSVSVDNFLRTDDSKSLLDYSSKTMGTDADTGNDCAIIKGIGSGSSTFDAKVVFGTSSLDGAANDIFNTINNMEIVDYSDPDGTFAQPYIDSANPDNIADTYFKAETNGKSYTQKKRNIIIDITSEGSTVDDTYKVFINVTYHYDFEYLIQNTNESGIGLGTYRPAEFSKDIVYSAIPAGASLHEDGTPLSCYVMYYPEYGTPSKPATDSITVNNLEDIPIKLLLVKQWMMTQSGDEYVEVSPTELLGKERGYLCDITENHSPSFNLEENREKLLYTNARVNLAFEDGVEEIPGVTYKVISGSYSTYKTRDIKDGGVITTTTKNRFFDLAIYLYEEGQIEDGGEPVAKFRATKAE